MDECYSVMQLKNNHIRTQVKKNMIQEVKIAGSRVGVLIGKGGATKERARGQKPTPPSPLTAKRGL